MTARERLTLALQRRAPDRVPIAFKTVGPFNGQRPRVQTDASYGRLTELSRRYCDVFHEWPAEKTRPYFSGSPEIRIDAKVARDGRETFTTVTTPEGTLTQHERVVEGSNWAIKHFIETDEDLDVFLRHTYVPARPDLSSFWREQERLGDAGLMRISLSDPIGMLAPLLPRETLYTWMMQEPTLVDRLHNVMFERLLDQVTYLAKSGVRCIFQFSGAEYAAPPMASPAHFERCVGRFGQPICDVLKAHGCVPMLHCHSRVGALIDTFIAMGYVATHPV